MAVLRTAASHYFDLESPRDLHGFDPTETGPGTHERLWLRGGFPRSYLADSDDASVAWREGFVRTFLERDLPQFGIRVSAAAMRRLWTMLAHIHGQLWNASELGRAMGLSDKTVRNYLDKLSQTFMVRQLQPWFENIGRRQVKSPKIYLRGIAISGHAGFTDDDDREPADDVARKP